MTHWTISHKWERYLTLLKDPEIKEYLPETKIYNKSSLSEMLNRYPSVFIKPIIGTGGRGIIKVSKADNQYVLQFVGIKKTFNDMEKLSSVTDSIVKKQGYMVQQGIEMIKIDQRPIDFRILVLKPYFKWEKMGVIGKIAGKNKFITNKAKGGKPISLAKALKKSLNYSEQQIKETESLLLSIAVRTGKILSKKYSYVREIGMDVAVDQNGKIWVFETNSMPMYELFRAHHDKDLYLRIHRYIMHIRRNYYRKRV